MLEIQPPDYKFCPFCGNPLEVTVLEGITRKFCSQDRWTYFPRVANAAVAVIQRGDEVFLVQRNKDPYKGTWMFPAGFVDFGEHPRETVIREVAEETGYKGDNPQLIDILQAKDDPREPGHLVAFYKVTVDESNKGKVTDPDENQSSGWFSKSKLPEIGWESHKEIARTL